MFPRSLIIVLWVLAGPLLVFEVYGIHQLRRSSPPSPDEALETVCTSLLHSARAKGLHNSAREIETVIGPESDPYFESLPPFLNARLAPGFKQYLVSDEVRKQTVQEISRLMKRHEWTGETKTMTQTLPEVLLLAEWAPLPFNEVRLTLRAVRLTLSGEGVQSSIRFTHPRFFHEQRHQRERLRLGLYASGAFLTALLILTLFHFSNGHTAGGSRHGTPS
jgi:hypothetical protein